MTSDSVEMEHGPLKKNPEDGTRSIITEQTLNQSEITPKKDDVSDGKLNKNKVKPQKPIMVRDIMDVIEFTSTLENE